jgi:hypothetical protein
LARKPGWFACFSKGERKIATSGLLVAGFDFTLVGSGLRPKAAQNITWPGDREKMLE